MTSIPPTTTTGATAAPTTTTTTDANAPNSTLADYDDFLTLLTAQLRNQDPLNPADGTEFVAQIATFTAVEQQVATVDRLDRLIELTNSSSFTELGAWIGRSVSASEAGIFYSGRPASFATPGEDGATGAQLVLRAADGREVRTLEVSPTGGTATWDGTDGAGATVPVGSYTAEIVYTKPDGAGGTTTVTRKLPAEGVVTEARLEDGRGVLVLDNGWTVASDAVTAVTAPSTSE